MCVCACVYDVENKKQPFQLTELIVKPMDKVTLGPVRIQDSVQQYRLYIFLF